MSHSANLDSCVLHSLEVLTAKYGLEGVTFTGCRKTHIFLIKDANVAPSTFPEIEVV